MEKKKYEYSYEIITKDGEHITNRMKKGITLKASSQSYARKILQWVYPKCTIKHLKTRTPMFINTDMANRLRT